MTIANTGKNRIRDLVANDIIEMELGTDGTDTSVSDTDLGTPITATVKTPTIVTADKTISTSFVTNYAEGNGNTFAEGCVKITGGVLLERLVFTDFAKKSALSLTVIDVIRII